MNIIIMCLAERKECTSAHGGSGYAPGSFMDGKAIVCGTCGTRIENPPPTGHDATGNPQFGDAVSGQKKRR